ncbi:MAG: glycosyltransferase family 2 protein [Chloroflexota bacterium]|nr:glycosyltransferase family 2 protein [Chloroflexota bacterium]
MEYTFVSILIPIRNEADTIRHCLDAVLGQDYPPERTEILVADGMSDDGTRNKLEALQEQHPNLYVFDNPKKIVPTGLNILIGQAKGEVIIRVDGHTIINPDYVRQCVRLLRSSGADNVGGRMDARGENFFGEVVALATSSLFGIGGARFHYSDKEEWVDTVYMGAWKREIFEKIGLFDEELVRNQDDEFNYRLRKFGGKILLSPKIKSTYTPRGSIKSLWKQYFQYGFWKVRVLQKHPKQMSLRQFVPPTFVLALFIGLVLGLFSHWGRIFLLAVIGSYLITDLVISFNISLRAKYLRYIILLPFVFATVHFGYGFGFLIGLIKFYNRWNDDEGKVPFLSDESISY